MKVASRTAAPAVVEVGIAAGTVAALPPVDRGRHGGGDVGLAILSVLAEDPSNGYGLINDR